MARGHFVDTITDEFGNVKQFAGLTLTLCQRGTTTAISDSVYTAFTGGTNLGQSVVVGQDGSIEFYYDAGGTHLPGIVTLYRAADSTFNHTISETVNCFGNPADTTPAGGIPANIVTAKGDIIAATGSGAVDNLASSGSNYDMLAVATGQSMGLGWLPIARQGADFVVYWDATNSRYTAAGPGQTTITNASDCGAVINSAITALAGAGTIQIIPTPTKRIYSVGTQISVDYNGIEIRGTGGNSSALAPLGPVTLKANASLTNLIKTNTPNGALVGYYFTLKDICLDGNNQTVNVVYLNQQHNSIVNCAISQGTSFCIRVDKLSGSIINTKTKSHDEDAVATPIGNVYINTTDCLITGCRFLSGGADDTYGVLALHGSANQVTNCHITGNLAGTLPSDPTAALLTTAAARQHISNVMFDTCDGSPFVIVGSGDVHLNNCLFYQSSSAVTGGAPAILATAAASTTLGVSNCTFKSGGANFTYAWEITGGGAEASGIFTGNHASNCTALADTRGSGMGLNMQSGKPTIKSGTASFSASKTKTVNHGLASTPTCVFVFPDTQTYFGNLYAASSGFTSTQFTVTSEVLTSDSFYWLAYM